MASAPAPTHDIAIAGAGLVGAAFALLLAEIGAGALSIALVEAKTPMARADTGAGGTEAPFESRVVALNEASRRLLERIGAWDSITAGRVCPYSRMEVRDSEGTGYIAFDCAEVRAPDLGHIAENRLVLAALLDRIAQVPSIDLRCPARITGIARAGDRIALDLDGEQIVAPLLVAADGARSPVRELLGFRVRGWSYGHSAIVATIRTETPHGYTARQWFTGTGPLALLPLRTTGGDSHYSSIVWSQQTAAAEALMNLDDAAFCKSLTEASEHCLGTVAEVTGRECVPLYQRHAIDYTQSGVALIGDAAHSLHPLAGQGVNLGFADARVLTEELARAHARGVALGDQVALSRYQRRRKPENLAMMAAMEGFKRLFEHPSPIARLLRNAGMSRLDALAPLKNRLIRQAMGH